MTEMELDGLPYHLQIMARRKLEIAAIVETRKARTHALPKLPKPERVERVKAERVPREPKVREPREKKVRVPKTPEVFVITDAMRAKYARFNESTPYLHRTCYHVSLATAK